MTDTLGRRIATLRKERGWTQYDLAAEVGVYWQSVGSWERGRKVPSLPSVIRLIVALETTPDALLEGLS